MHLVTAGDCDFAKAGSKLWNVLPLPITSAMRLDVVKARL